MAQHFSAMNLFWDKSAHVTTFLLFAFLILRDFQQSQILLFAQPVPWLHGCGGAQYWVHDARPSDGLGGRVKLACTGGEAECVTLQCFLALISELINLTAKQLGCPFVCKFSGDGNCHQEELMHVWRAKVSSNQTEYNSYIRLEGKMASRQNVLDIEQGLDSRVAQNLSCRWLKDPTKRDGQSCMLPLRN